MKKGKKSKVRKIAFNPIKGRRWFAAQSHICISAIGKPKQRDQFFESKSVFIEERVYLFKANGFADAMRKAETEAKAYCRNFRRNDVNKYGQRLAVRPSGYVVFDLFEAPGENVEVFSSMWIMKGAEYSKLLTEIHKGRGKAWDRRISNFIGTRPNKKRRDVTI